MPSLLDSLRQHTVVVADTGDFDAMRTYRPTDATTNPTLILKAAQSEAGKPLLDEVIRNHPSASADELLDRLLVAFGCEILGLIPGRVSTEVDARLSFDIRATVERGRRLIALYEDAGIPRERILIKIASTWEGVEAARILQAEEIRCNMTLLFCLPQAVACAQAKAQLISPFVGRIYDWHRKSLGADWVEVDHAGVNDPGVRSVSGIHQYYKHYGIATEIMGASFRNTGQVLALAGCDLLTISPQLLQELSDAQGEVVKALTRQAVADAPVQLDVNEPAFRFALNEDAMATEKLAEGIRVFSADARKLDSLIVSARREIAGG